MFKVAEEEMYDEKIRKKFALDDINDRDNIVFESSVRSQASDEDNYRRPAFSKLRLDDPGDSKLTRKNVQV